MITEGQKRMSLLNDLDSLLKLWDEYDKLPCSLKKEALMKHRRHCKQIVAMYRLDDRHPPIQKTKHPKQKNYSNYNWLAR